MLREIDALTPPVLDRQNSFIISFLRVSVGERKLNSLVSRRIPPAESFHILKTASTIPSITYVAKTNDQL